MILLDSHIWVWLVSADHLLNANQKSYLKRKEADGLAVSVISIWELALKVESGNLKLSVPIDPWLKKAVKYPGVKLLNLGPKIARESTRLPGDFHKDPADRFLVATARHYDCELVTVDAKILAYPHVKATDGKHTQESSS